MKSRKIVINLFFQLLAFAFLSLFSKQVRSKKITVIELINIFWRKSGLVALNVFFDRYLVDAYRTRTVLRLAHPSIAFFRKFEHYFSDDFKDLQLSKTPYKTKILLLRDGAMGDVIMLTPVVRELYNQRLGAAVIDISTYCKEVFKNSPYVNRVLNPKDLEKSKVSYDLVISFNGLYERDIFKHPVDSYSMHALGAHNYDKKLDIFYTSSDVEYVRAKLKNIDPGYLVFHKPVHEWPNRNLDENFWTRLMDGLVKSTGLKIIQIGSGGDFACEEKSSIYDHRGLYDIQKIAALIEMSAGFVGIDAGPSHIAASTAAPIFTFYTCAHHDARKPLRTGGIYHPIIPDVECYGCMQRSKYPQTSYCCERGDNACVSAFTVEKVIDLVRNAIAHDNI